MKRVKRTYSTKQKMYVIYLRYGLITEYSKIAHTWTEIGQITSIKPDTCQKIVKAFHKKNNKIESTTKRGKSIQPLPPDVTEYLRTSLEDNKFLSLRQRVKIIENKFDFPIPSRLDFVCPNHTRLRTERCLPRWCIRFLLFQASYVCVERLDQGQGP